MSKPNLKQEQQRWVSAVAARLVWEAHFASAAAVLDSALAQQKQTRAASPLPWPAQLASSFPAAPKAWALNTPSRNGRFQDSHFRSKRTSTRAPVAMRLKVLLRPLKSPQLAKSRRWKKRSLEGSEILGNR